MIGQYMVGKDMIGRHASTVSDTVQSGAHLHTAASAPHSRRTSPPAQGRLACASPRPGWQSPETAHS